MNEDAMRSIIVNAVNELAPVLWAAQSAALAAANTRCRGLVHDKYPSLRPHLIRSELREYLEREHLPEGWVLGGDTRKMVQIYVRNETVCLRYLKERRVTYPGGVPAAGRAPSRRAYWAPSLFGPPGLPGGRLNLLLLWDYLDPADPESGFVMRVVHTTSTGAWGSRTPIDLSVDLAPTLGLEGYLRFHEDPQDTDFFADLSENRRGGEDDGMA